MICPLHDDDDEFLDRVRTARCAGWSGPEADVVWRRDIVELVRAVGMPYSGVDEGDVLYWVWDSVSKLDLGRVEKCPRGWVLKTVKFRLRDHLAKESESERLVQELIRWERPIQISAPADAFLDENPWQGEDVPVWETLTAQLVRWHWPEQTAARVVSILQEIAERAAFGGKPFPSESTIAGKLKGLPWGMSTALAGFVFARHGFLWAILKGVDPARALYLPSVEEALEKVVWPVDAEPPQLANAQACIQ